jgi:hypothetical protein
VGKTCACQGSESCGDTAPSAEADEATAFFHHFPDILKGLKFLFNFGHFKVL